MTRPNVRRDLDRLRQEAGALAASRGGRVTALPPVAEFRRLPRRQQIDLLVNYDSTPAPGPPAPDPAWFESYLAWFDGLPMEERERVYDELLDSAPGVRNMMDCYDCLRHEDQLLVDQESLKRLPPGWAAAIEGAFR
jgi:hypothetical protein